MKGSTVVIAVAALAAFGMMASTAEASPDRLRAASITMAPGEHGAIGIMAEDLSEPGLSAWSVDITWDEAVVDARFCSSTVSECSTEFASNTGRITGASAEGLVEDTILATFTFECGPNEGESAATLSIEVWAEGSTGPADPDVDIQNGTITCAEPGAPEPTATPASISLPPTGSGASSGGSAIAWPAALLAAAGAALAGTAALRRKGR